MEEKKNQLTDYDYLVKLLLIGESGVGKSSLMSKFVDPEHFTPAQVPTIGVDFMIRTIDIAGKRVKIQIWDTAGQERFRSIARAYFRGADGIVLTYDTTNRDSFSRLPYWLEEVNSYAKDNVKLLLVGNKKDLVTSENKEECVDTSLAESFASDRGIGFFEASAVEGINVETSILHLTQDVMETKIQEYTRRWDLLQDEKEHFSNFKSIPIIGRSPTLTREAICCSIQ